MPNPLRLAVLGLTLAALAACSPPKRIHPAPARTAAERPAAAESAPTGELLAARAAVDEARQLMPGWTEGEELLREARVAANRGDNGRAQTLAAEAGSRAAFVLDAHYLALAQLELQKVQVYTGLTDAQLEQVRRAELALARGEGRKAYERLSQLGRTLAEATQRYVVAAGDSLWVISGRPGIYGNPWLWPLIWQANLEAIPNPDRLLAGQKLKIKPNPTIEEVVDAVEYARRQTGRRIRIGEVREAGP